VRRPTWLALALVIALALPAAAHADKSYSLPRAVVTVTLARSGEVLVHEDITFSYSGTFTGAYRDVPLASGVDVGGVVSEAAGLFAGRQRRSAAATRPGALAPCACHRACASSGTTCRAAVSARSRSATGCAESTAYDDAVEVAPQVWGISGRPDSAI
jgi:hypothetical protein